MDTEIGSTTALLREGTLVFTWKPVYLVLKPSFLLIYARSETKVLKNDPSLLFEVILFDSNWKVEAMKFFSITGKDEGFEIQTSQSSVADRVSRLVFCLPQSDHWVDLISEVIRKSSRSVSASFKAKPVFLRQSEQDLNNMPKNEPTAQLIVCSYNVNFALCDLENIGDEEPATLEAIIRTNADILCLQETTEDWEAFLKPRLRKQYPYSHFDHSQVRTDERRPLAGGIAVLSKFPLEVCKIIPSPCEWFPAQLLVVSTPIGNCQILNLHLRPPLSERALPTPGAYFDSKNDRLLECLYYATYLDQEQPLIVCGDFNEGHSGPSVLFWKKYGLHSSLEAHDPSAITWWWPLPGGIKITKTYDHIFSSVHFSCPECFVVNAGPSDHYPLVARFERFIQSTKVDLP